MSYYDDSSLFVAPNGYKASVLFAQKPMDANGQLAFTRSNNTATRVASNGLIEKVRTNLALYSEDQTNAAWTKTNVSVTGDTTANPVNGATTADTFTITTQTTVQGLSQSFTADGSIYTISVFLKKEATSKTISLKIRDSIGSGTTYATADLNLNTGVVSAVSGVASVVDYDANWWRFIVTTSTAPAAGTRSIVLRVANVAVSETFTVFGAMLEKGDIATPYIATTSAARSVGPVANIPRIDYLGGGCGKLLLEPQRTNLVTFSESFDNAGWSKTGVGVTANNSTSPDGNTNADKLFNSVGTTGFASQTISLVSSTIYSGSVFAKNAGRDSLFILFSGSGGSASCTFNLTTLTTTPSGGVTAKIEDYGGGWYRCSVVFTATSTGSSAFRIYPSLTTGDGTSGIFIYGAQLEAGAYATSYVNTLAASVTRGADDPSKTGISSLIGSEAGTMYLEFSALANDLTERRIAVSNGTTANVARIGYTNVSNRITAVLFNGANQCVLAYDGADITQTVKVAFTWAVNDFALFVNGVKRSSDNSGTTFAANTLSQLQFDRGDGGPDPYFGKIDELLLFKSRLSDTDLAALTTL